MIFKQNFHLRLMRIKTIDGAPKIPSRNISNRSFFVFIKEGSFDTLALCGEMSTRFGIVQSRFNNSVCSLELKNNLLVHRLRR